VYVGAKARVGGALACISASRVGGALGRHRGATAKVAGEYITASGAGLRQHPMLW